MKEKIFHTIFHFFFSMYNSPEQYFLWKCLGKLASIMSWQTGSVKKLDPYKLIVIILMNEIIDRWVFIKQRELRGYIKMNVEIANPCNTVSSARSDKLRHLCVQYDSTPL